jgi:hypothetical protein
MPKLGRPARNPANKISKYNFRKVFVCLEKQLVESEMPPRSDEPHSGTDGWAASHDMLV